MMEESMAQTMLRAEESYRKDARFRAIATGCVVAARQELGRVDPENADHDAHEIAIRANILLLQRIFEEDAELHAMRLERDHYRKVAERAVNAAAPRLFIPEPPK